MVRIGEKSLLFKGLLMSKISDLPLSEAQEIKRNSLIYI